MSDEISGKKTVIIKFLGEDLEISMKDRIDPVFIMFISLVELVEMKYNEGELWVEHLEKNYGLTLGNASTRKRMMDILLNNTKREINKDGNKQS